MAKTVGKKSSLFGVLHSKMSSIVKVRFKLFPVLKTSKHFAVLMKYDTRYNVINYLITEERSENSKAQVRQED